MTEDEKFKYCVAAGVKTKTRYEVRDGRTFIIKETINPCAVVFDDYGRIIVYEGPPRKE